MRTLTDHIVDGDSVNHQVTITVTDERGSGGASHAYSLSWANERDQTEPYTFIRFQNGPIKQVGVNGLTHEALLAVVIDRLRSFQAGPYACNSNEMALSACQAALAHLKERTRERIQRGVEGTHRT